MKHRGVIVLVAVALTTGCVLLRSGPSLKGGVPAGGFETTVRLYGGTLYSSQGIQGELLAVSDTALVLLSGDRILHVPLRLVRSAIINAGGAPTISRRLPAGGAEAWRVRSRFPHGMSEQQTKLLLTFHGLAAVEIVEQVQ